MFKKILILVVSGLLFFNVAFAQNITSTDQDLLAVIKQLQVQIQLLQEQIADLQIQVQSVKTELKFSRVLTQGATGDDVKQLQEFLKTFTGAYPDGLITGYFGPLTKAAVKNFQEQNGIESVGIVGPKTQDKLNVLAAAIPATPAISSSETGMPVTPAIQTTPIIETTQTVQFTSSKIKVLSPNGREQWQIGGTYTIKYSAENIAGDKALLIYLEKGYDAPTTKTGVNSSLLIGVTTNLESYTYKVPSNIQSWPGLGSNYTIKIYVEGSYSANDAVSYIGDSSDGMFSIIAAQVNTLNTTISVSGGGGGGQVQSTGQTIAITVPVVQTMSTTQTTQNSIASTSFIKVLSPNGGETFIPGQIYKIKWTGGNNTIDVFLLDNPTRLGRKIFSGVINNGYVDWIASSLSSDDLYDGTTNAYKTPSGQYIIWVGCTDNNCTVDDSDFYFKITE